MTEDAHVDGPAAVPSAPDDAVETAASDAVDAVAPAASSPRPRRRALPVAFALSLLAVVGLAVPLVMLALARDSWEGQNADLRAAVEDLTDEVSAQNMRLAELETVEQQLATLKSEYSAAVNQGAKGVEGVEELEDIIEAFERCIDAQADHFDVLRNAERYVASSVEASERSIRDYCDEVADAYAAFQSAHG
ncbi:hypothetical protein [Demequina mangrovi]|uniref:Uncharacterized protein n=1 Tax=Demequina mangrovi TaxID=1043493 RepID=A0A1H6ZBN1_9MICO|nr:hypothetical protein [Demequina mangrovi]SEJ46295.1 hypothetical protein SAMN05421637_1868 [Demequina mangrovi]